MYRFDSCPGSRGDGSAFFWLCSRRANESPTRSVIVSPPEGSLRVNLTKSALRLDGEEHTLGHVLAAAWIGDMLETAWVELEQQLACQALASAENLSIPSGQLQAAFNEWRRDRDLITADDLRRVLDDLHLAVSDIVGCCKRKLIAEAAQHRRDEALARFPVQPSDVLHLLPLHVFFGHDVEDIIKGVAHRWLAPASDAPNIPVSKRCTHLLDPREGADARRLFGVDEAGAPVLARHEAAYLAYRHAVVTTAALERILEEMRPDLVQLRLAVTTSPSNNVAREVVCCVRNDGEAINKVGERAELAVEARDVLLRDAGTLPFGGRLASAQAGDVLGPVPSAEGYMVAAVLSRHDPQLSRAEVRAVVENRLLDRLLGPEMVKRVSFSWQL